MLTEALASTGREYSSTDTDTEWPPEGDKYESIRNECAPSFLKCNCNNGRQRERNMRVSEINALHRS